MAIGGRTIHQDKKGYFYERMGSRVYVPSSMVTTIQGHKVLGVSDKVAEAAFKTQAQPVAGVSKPKKVSAPPGTILGASKQLWGQYQHFSLKGLMVKRGTWKDPRTGKFYHYDPNIQGLVPTGYVGKPVPGFHGGGDVRRVSVYAKPKEVEKPPPTEAEKTVVRKKHLEEAKVARETEKTAGKTVHTIAYHLQQANTRRAQQSLGGKAYGDMAPSEQKQYKELVKKGRTPDVAAALADAAPEQIAKYYEIRKEDPEIKVAVAIKQAKAVKPPEPPKEPGRLPTPEPSPRAAKLISKITGRKGYEAWLAEIKGIKPVTLAEARASQIEYEHFKKTHTELPDGKFIADYQLTRIKKDMPEAHKIITTQGYTAYTSWVNKQNALYRDNQAAITKLKPYTDKDDGIDGAKYLRDHPKDRKTLTDAGFSGQDVAGWRKWNAQPFMQISPLERWWSKVDKAGGSGLNVLEFQAFLNKHQSLAREGKKIILTPPPKPVKPVISLEQFTTGYMQARGISPPIAGVAFTKKQADSRQLATMEYARLYGGKAAVKEIGMTYADVLVPGVYVARNWTTLSTKDKVINIGIDVASVLLCVGIFKVAGAGIRQLSGVSKVSRVAKHAGKAGRELQLATKEFNQAQKVLKLKVGSKLWVKHANKLERLQRASMKADRQFLETLERLEQIAPRDLARIERQSGLKGLAKAIKDIGKAQKSINKAWKELETLPIFTEARTPRQILMNNRHLVALAKLQKAQARLEAALNRTGSALKPRYSYGPPASEFKGYGMQWEAGKPAPRIGGKKDPTTIEAIESWLARSREVATKGDEPWLMSSRARVATAVAEKPKVTPKYRLKLKALYKEAKPKARPKAKPKVPKVKRSVFPRIKPKVKVAVKVAALPKPRVKTSVFPGIKPKVKEVVRVTAPAIPSHAWGRATYARIAKEYGTDAVVDAVGSTMEEQLRKLKELGRISTKEWATVREAVRESIREYIKAQEAGKTATQTKSAVKEAIQTKLRGVPAVDTVAVTKAVTRLVTKPITPVKIITKPLVAKPPVEKVPTPKGPVPPIRLRRRPIITIEKVVGKPKVNPGTVSWRQGKVTISIEPPYKLGTDDVAYSPSPKGSTGTPQQTIRTRFGRPPKEIELGMGVVRATVKRGRHIRFARQHIKL